MKKASNKPAKKDLKIKKKVGLSESAIIEIDRSLNSWASGKSKPSDVRKIMKKHGVTGDLREASRGSVEVYPIGGGSGTKIEF